MNNHGRITCADLVAAGVALTLVLGTLYLYIEPRTSRKGTITKAISNCRQIITAMRIYSADHGGKYPDAFLTHPQNSNEVFRVLFKERYTDDEMIFGSPVSPYVPDGNLSHGPDYSKALEAGENHWAMTTGLSDAMSGHIPLVYENPVSSSLPPKWNPSAKGTNTPGRAWSTGIIVGLNDGSVSIRPLESKSGTSVGLAKEEDGKDLFGAALDPVKFPERRMLDILREGK